MPWTNQQARERVIRTLLGEGDGTTEGMTAVANVIKNRADSGAWGDPFKGGLTRTITAPKQFSMWNTDDPKLVALANRANAIPTSDPRYQRAAAITDGVFGNDIPDITGGANHYHATTVSPDWAQGQPRKFIGSQYFYKLPLTASNTAGTAVVSPSTVGQGGSAAPTSAPTPAPAPAAPAASPIVPIQSFTGGDYGRQATAAAKPFQGIVIHIAGKPDLQSELAYNSTPDANRGGAYYGYHYLIDRDGKVYQTAPDNVRTNHIQGSAATGLNNENAIGVSFIGGAPAGKNPLPMTPEQQAAGIALVNQLKAKYNIDPSKIVSHGELDASRASGLNPDGGAEGADFIKAYRLTGAPAATPAGFKFSPAAMSTPISTVTGQPVSAPVSAPAVNPNAPAAQAQPVAATAPAGAASTPGPAANPAAGFVGPGSDKYSLVKSITSGTSHNPQLTTAANWGNLFGGAAPAAPPAAAAAAPAAAAPASAPTVPPGAPVNQPPSSPMASILPAWGAGTYSNDPWSAPEGVHPWQMPGGGVNGEPAMTEGGPSMGFPAMTNPFGQPPPDQQVSMLPGSMLVSAQDLIRRLFPSSVG